MNYENWSFRNLLRLKADLEKEIVGGQPLQGTLTACNAEIAARKFALVGVHDGKVVKEYDRLRTAAACEDLAADALGFPVGVEQELNGKTFYTRIDEK